MIPDEAVCQVPALSKNGWLELIRDAAMHDGAVPVTGIARDERAKQTSVRPVSIDVRLLSLMRSAPAHRTYLAQLEI